jgi:hypothetical protein
LEKPILKEQCLEKYDGENVADDDAAGTVGND